MSDTLALLALMKKDEGLTEEQVNQVIDSKNLQPKLTAGDNITIDENNIINSTGLNQGQVNALINSKNLQPKLTAGTNITIDSNNVISSIDTGVSEEQVNTLIDNKNLQPKLTAGENITISADNVISSTDTGLNETEVNTLIDNKNLQPKLTAGTNITIEGNVISATGGGSSLPETPTNNGNYSLVATVKDGGIEFAWKSISGVWQLPTKINNDLKLFQAATINKINNTLEVY